MSGGCFSVSVCMLKTVTVNSVAAKIHNILQEEASSKERWEAMVSARLHFWYTILSQETAGYLYGRSSRIHKKKKKKLCMLSSRT